MCSHHHLRITLETPYRAPTLLRHGKLITQCEQIACMHALMPSRVQRDTLGQGMLQPPSKPTTAFLLRYGLQLVPLRHNNIMLPICCVPLASMVAYTLISHDVPGKLLPSP